MPVYEMKPGRSAEHGELVDALASELTNPNSGNTEPVILLERDKQKRPLHVYVIWKQWRDVDRAERGEIIMDAAERHFSQDDVLNISIAMGLTPDEAKRLGLKY
jgi:hypothetical protein